MNMTGLRTGWLIGYYALGRDKFSAETISVNSFLSERVDFKGLYGRWRLRVIGFCSSRSDDEDEEVLNKAIDYKASKSVKRVIWEDGQDKQKEILWFMFKKSLHGWEIT